MVELQVHELKGVNAPELRSQVDLLLFQAFPCKTPQMDSEDAITHSCLTAHPHTALSLPAIEALSVDPILFAQVPVLNTVLTKLISFIDAAPDELSKAELKQTLAQSMVPYLKTRFASTKANSSLPSASKTSLVAWSKTTVTLVDALPVSELFPLVDMWRLAILDPVVGTWCASTIAKPDTNPIFAFLTKAAWAVNNPASNSRNFILTMLRLLSNAFSSSDITRQLLSDIPAAGEHVSPRSRTTDVLISTLLHENAAVRTAAASLVFNVAAYLQKGRVNKERNPGADEEIVEDGDWEVELISSVIEALGRETGSEEVGP